MMSQTNLPIYSYENDKKNPVIHYSNSFGNFYFVSRAWYDNSDLDSERSKRVFFNMDLNFQSKSRYYFLSSEGANSVLEGEGEGEGAEGCHPLTLHNVEHIDQQRGARHYLLGNKDVKIMKNLTIILIGCMTLALKLLAMFTLSMGSIIIKCALLIFMCQNV